MIRPSSRSKPRSVLMRAVRFARSTPRPERVLHPRREEVDVLLCAGTPARRGDGSSRPTCDFETPPNPSSTGWRRGAPRRRHAHHVDQDESRPRCRPLRVHGRCRYRRSWSGFEAVSGRPPPRRSISRKPWLGACVGRLDQHATPLPAAKTPAARLRATRRPV